jgi:hypothetical protein
MLPIYFYVAILIVVSSQAEGWYSFLLTVHRKKIYDKLVTKNMLCTQKYVSLIFHILGKTYTKNKGAILEKCGMRLGIISRIVRSIDDGSYIILNES